ncbi:MAG: SDR family oxidoreductase [Alphaproteobacteria bacterium]|nr:SDR family oxidoreductase [Alphaproteobacteria bacterium]
MQVRLDGRIALITGGSLGIGRAIAATFAESGAGVALVARRQDVLDEAATAIRAATGGEVIAIAADVATAKGCEHAVDRAQAVLGPIDILVNNAGSSKRGPFEEHDDAVWQADLDLKLFAAIRLCRRVMPEMRERRWGRVINILNTGAKAPPGQGAPTAVTRAAGMALTKALANEYAPHNVLVNALLVGRIESDQWVRRHADETGDRSLDDYYAEMGRSIPMGRVGTAEEFAAMACLLASDRGGYVTGTAINVDGGLCPVV